MKIPSNTPPANPAKPLTRVISSFLFHQGKFLILKRSMLVGSFQGYWSCISGYREENEQPLETALREILEETQKTRASLTLLKSAGPFYSEIPAVIFESHWFLLNLKIKTFPWIGNMMNLNGLNPRKSENLKPSLG